MEPNCIPIQEKRPGKTGALWDQTLLIQDSWVLRS